MQNLALLNISYSKLNDFWSSPCDEHLYMHTVDVSMDRLLSIDTDDWSCVEKLSVIITDQWELCCLRKLTNKCRILSYIETGCSSLIPWSSVQALFIIIILVTGVGNSLVIAYTMGIKCRDYQLIGNLAVANILVLEPLVLAVVWNSRFGTELHFHKTSLHDTIWCKMTSFLTQVSTQTSISIGTRHCYFKILRHKKETF